MNFNDAMNDVLKTRRYDFLTGRRVDAGEYLNDLVNKFLKSISDLFSFEMSISASGGTGTVVVIFAVITVVLVAFAVYFLVRTKLRSRKVVRHTLENLFEEMKHHTVEELMQLSESAENRRISVRYKYIAVILSLNERHIIVIQPSSTNAVILKQIKTALPELAVPFSQVTEAFHYAWFGHKELSEENYSSFIVAVNKLLYSKVNPAHEKLPRNC